MLDYATQYHERGFIPVPVEFGGKRPLSKDWQRTTLSDVDLRLYENDAANVGILLGDASGGLVDIDIDSPLALAIADRYLPDTGMVFGRDSKPNSHWVYTVKEAGATMRLQSRALNGETLIEYRANGCQTVFPPSVHPSGEVLQFTSGELGKPAFVTSDELKCAAKAIAAVCVLAEQWTEGSRQDKTMALAGWLLKQQWPLEHVKHLLASICIASGDTASLSQRLSAADTTYEKLSFNPDAHITGFTRLKELIGDTAIDEISGWLGLRKEPELVLVSRDSVPISYDGTDLRKQYDYSDIGAANKFAEQYFNRARFSHAEKKWYVWNGRQWTQDNDSRIGRFVQGHCKELAKAAIENHDGNKVSSLLGQRKVKSTEMLARDNMPVSIDEFDSHRMLFNCQNGVMDLEGLRFIEHDAALMMRQISPVTFDANAECSLWETFLERVMGGNRNLIDFLRRAVGYSLSGENTEQCMFILIGEGKNGKSTFINAIKELMGGYANTMGIESLVATSGSRQSNDLARLHRSRFVYASEAECSQRLAEARIKAITGGEAISARFLYQEYFEFVPQFKLWLMTNNMPTITGTDEGLWRRLMFVPFNVTITEEERDPALPEKLRAELPGILNWAFKGCLEWQELGGLCPPEEVTLANQHYRMEMDSVAQFIDDCCERRAGAWVANSDLYNKYVQWCGGAGETPLKTGEFGKRLKRLGFDGAKRNGTRVRGGIELISLMEN